MNPMTTQAVPLSDLNQLASVLCDIDEEQAKNCKNPAISNLVDKAHHIIISLMGEHAVNHYAPEE